MTSAFWITLSFFISPSHHLHLSCWDRIQSPSILWNQRQWSSQNICLQASCLLSCMCDLRWEVLVHKFQIFKSRSWKWSDYSDLWQMIIFSFFFFWYKWLLNSSFSYEKLETSLVLVSTPNHWFFFSHVRISHSKPIILSLWCATPASVKLYSRTNKI